MGIRPLPVGSTDEVYQGFPIMTEAFLQVFIDYLTDNTPPMLKLRQFWLPAVSRLPVLWIEAPNIASW